MGWNRFALRSRPCVPCDGGLPSRNGASVAPNEGTTVEPVQTNGFPGGTPPYFSAEWEESGAFETGPKMNEKSRVGPNLTAVLNPVLVIFTS